MSLTVHDITFQVCSAVIRAGISERGLNWVIEVETHEQNFLDTFAAPHFKAESLSIEVSDWRALEGKLVDLIAPFNEQIGHRAYSYFWSHEPIPKSTIEFGERSGLQFYLTWKGVCDPWWADPLEENVPFVIQAWAIFKNVYVGCKEGDTEELMLERFSRFFDIKDFVQLPIQNPAPCVYYSIFEPKETL